MRKFLLLPAIITFYSMGSFAQNDSSNIISLLHLQAGLPQYPWIKIDATISSASGNIPLDSKLDVRGFNTSIGISVDLSKLKKKTSSK